MPAINQCPQELKRWQQQNESDPNQALHHMEEMARLSVKETLNAMPDAEASHLYNACCDEHLCQLKEYE